jgi:hypothetical protein
MDDCHGDYQVYVGSSAEDIVLNDAVEVSKPSRRGH